MNPHEEEGFEVEERLCGWWITSSGDVEEGEEFGFHGEMAHRMISVLCEKHGLTYDEPQFDAAIAHALSLGFIRVSTFHGSQSMHIDCIADRVTAPALRAMADLVKDYKESFSEYVFEFENGEPKEFLKRGVVQKHLLDQAKTAPNTVDASLIQAVIASDEPTP